MYQKSQSYGVCFLKYEAQQLSFWVIFCPFTPLTTWKIKILENEENSKRYHHFTLASHKWQSYNVRFLRYGAWKTEFLSFWTIFFSFTTLTTQNVKILKKWKKTPGDIIILHVSTINKKSYDTWFLRYGAWQTGFFLNFLLFYQPKNFWKNEKKTPRATIILHLCTINENHVMYGSWDIECNRQNFLSLWTILCPVTPLTPQEIKNFEIMKKKTTKIPSF